MSLQSSPPSSSDFLDCFLSFSSALRGASEKVYSWQRAAFRSEVLATLEALEAAATQLTRACDVWAADGIGALEVFGTSNGGGASPPSAQATGDCDWSYVVTVFGSCTAGTDSNLSTNNSLSAIPPIPLVLREESTAAVALALVRSMRAGALLARAGRGVLNVLEGAAGAPQVAALAAQIRSQWVGPVVDGWVRTGARVDHAAYQWLLALCDALLPAAATGATGSSATNSNPTALCVQELLLLLQIIISEKHPVLPLTLGAASMTSAGNAPDLTATSSFQVARVVMTYLGATGLPAISRSLSQRDGQAFPPALMSTSRLDVLRGLSVIQLLCGRNLTSDAAAAQQALLAATVPSAHAGSSQALSVLLSALSVLVAPNAFSLVAASADAPPPTGGSALRIYDIFERLLSLLHTASVSLDVCRALGRHGGGGDGSGVDPRDAQAPGLVLILHALQHTIPFLLLPSAAPASNDRHDAVANSKAWAATVALHALGSMQNACRDRECLDQLLAPRPVAATAADPGGDTVDKDDNGAVPTLLRLIVAPTVPSAVKAAAVTVLMLLVENQIQSRSASVPESVDEAVALNDASARADVRRLLRLALTSSELAMALEAV